jgi:hypothetical protein
MEREGERGKERDIKKGERKEKIENRKRGSGEEREVVYVC